jgi:hypothetical protein
MKQIFRSLVNKATVLLDENVATRDRSIAFRITTLTLLSGTVVYILISVIKTIG